MGQQIVPVISLEKLYIAKILQDDNTGVKFDTPKYLAGVKEISVKPKVAVDEFYAEGMLWLSDTTLANIDVEVNITDLTDEDEAFLLGHKLAEGGGIIYGANDVAPDVAILFKARKGNGKARYVILYNGKFSISDEDYKGKEGKSNFQAKKLKAGFAPLHNNEKWKYKIDEDSTDAPVDIDTKFFTSVIVPKEKVLKTEQHA
ncbi:phage tail protein [Clostridium sp. P21]|uniref:Phage tail protein n=1 Tax=Clostridium muellerianum TaxID=2716538 RepID=A0A7Y0EL98_9CLOT|nr:major tail protein [Clostridium muellerianum]NMM65497.1 phage tail protein [Clostridium muellerianum]